jgi:diguanylate cyclase (GGDEF)-like protein/PAS domain S-box-containing protein
VTLNTGRPLPISRMMTTGAPTAGRDASDPIGLDRAALLDDLPDAVLVMGPDARLIWGNYAAEIMFGRSLEESIGMSCLEVVHPDDLEMALVSLGSMQFERIGAPLELRISTPTGWRQVEMIGASRRDHIVLVIRDLTERRRWEVAHDGLAQLRSVLQHLSTVAMVLDPSGRVRTTSAAITRLLGIGQRAIEGRHITMMVPGRSRVALGRAVHEVLAAETGAKVAIDVEAYCADRSTLPVAISMVNLVDDPTVGGLVVTITDISRRSQAEREREETSAVLAATLESVADGIVTSNADGIPELWNRQFAEMWNIPEEIDRSKDLRGLLGHLLSMVDDPVGFERRLAEIHADPYGLSEDTVQLADGRVLERRSRPRHVDGEPVGRVWSFRDVTETRRLQADLARQALHDPLTGLANQVLFRQALQHALATAADGRSVALMFVDLDDFKAVNDTLGHSSGDLLLVEVADRLRSVVRATDTVARLGGDEFVVLLVDIEDQESAIDVARRTMEALVPPVELPQDTVCVGASIGVAVAEPNMDADGLLRSADLAMYHAKQSGRNQFRLYTPDMGRELGRRGSADSRLRGAAGRGELVVHYQPIVDTRRDNTIVAMEALVRWMHPERGLVMPGEFIPYAEASGIIEEIGMHVLEVACRHATEWHEHLGMQAPIVSVNLSPHQLVDEMLPERVADVLDRTGLDPSRLVLEFTEGALMQDPATVARQIRAVRRSGVHLAIDDFGTGHSSLARLQQFPIDSLKIDRSFVSTVGDRTGSSLVLAIVQLAHTLDMLTVAEGVQTPEQQARLDELGSDLSQGFLHHRPIPAEEVLPLLLGSNQALMAAAAQQPAATPPLR